MIKRDFYVWDFIENKPKRHILGDTVVIGDNGYINLGDNVYVWGNTLGNTFSHTVTSTQPNLCVSGTITPQPREGDMRTVMVGDGYWSTQFYTEAVDGPVWVTTSRIQSMVTLDGTLDFTKKSVWSKIKSWFKKK